MLSNWTFLISILVELEEAYVIDRLRRVVNF